MLPIGLGQNPNSRQGPEGRMSLSFSLLFIRFSFTKTFPCVMCVIPLQSPVCPGVTKIFFLFM